MPISYQSLAPFYVLTEKGAYNATCILSNEVDPIAHPQAAQLINETKAAHEALLIQRRSQDFHNLTHDRRTRQTKDSNIDDIGRTMYKVISSDIARNEKAGTAHPLPNAVQMLWPKGFQHYRAQRGDVQCGETRLLLKELEKPAMHAYLRTVQLDGFIPMLRTLNDAFSADRTPYNTRISSVELAENKSQAKARYFRMCVAVMGLNAESKPNGMALYQRLRELNESFRSYRNAKLRNNATPEEEAAVNADYDASLPALDALAE